MNEFCGRRVLVIGLARAGTAMADALAKAGADVIVVDQKSADSASLLEAMDKLQGLDIEILTSWTGDVDWQKTDLVAPSPGVPKNHPTLLEALRRGVAIWSEVEIACRLAKAPIIAVTGTNGKSTVVALVHHILQENGKKSMLSGNIAGSGLPEQPITTAAARAPKDAVLVSEVSSFQLDWIAGFKPVACTITNITPDHLDRYGSFEEYAATKRKIFLNQDQDDHAVVNLLQPATMANATVNARKLEVGRNHGDAVISEEGISFPSENAWLGVEELWCGGIHNLENAAAACLLAHSQGVSLTDAAAPVRTFRGILNRMELVAQSSGVRFVNNSMCTNPQALRASLQANLGPTILLAGGISKLPSGAAFAGIATSNLQAAFVFGADAKTLRASFAADGCDASVSETLEDAFSEAIRRAEPGDTILLSPGCASFDQFEDFIERGEAFRRLVRDHIGSSPK